MLPVDSVLGEIRWNLLKHRLGFFAFRTLHSRRLQPYAVNLSQSKELSRLPIPSAKKDVVIMSVTFTQRKGTLESG